jgi:fatty-acyl-CoA synthase
MRKDERGFFRFVDRIGDTFRWKGENVATREVADVLASCPGVRTACVFGVRVPAADGRAGMAALVVRPGFDAADLERQLASRLPAYARPVFLRLVKAVAVTETFKQQKHDLAREGFDPGVVADPLYFRDDRAGGYVRLDPTLFADLAAGRVRV